MLLEEQLNAKKQMMSELASKKDFTGAAAAHEDVLAEVVMLGKAEGNNAFLGPIYSGCERCVVVLCATSAGHSG